MSQNFKHFHLRTPSELLLKLRWGINRFNEAVELNAPSTQYFPAVYYAFDCGITAWSMVDWVWKTHGAEIAQRPGMPKNKAEFAEYIRNKSRYLKICYQLATSAKHLGVDSYPDAGLVTEVSYTTKPMTAGSPVGQPLRYHQYFFNVNDSGDALQAGEVLEGAYQFWCIELKIDPV